MGKDAKKEQKKRFALDHSARFYPITSTKKAQSLFCMSARMREDVDKDVLENALNDVLERFCAYKVCLKRGWAWHYFEHNDKRAKVFDNDILLKPISPKDTNGYWFRVSVVDRNIKLEMFHALSDGNGAMDFLKSLIKRYCQLKGVDMQDDCVIDWQSEAHCEEIEDSFERHYKPIPLSQMNLKELAGSAPLRLGGSKSENGYLHEEAIASVDAIIEKAKKTSVTFTSYLTGVLAYSIEHVAPKKKKAKPIVIMVPVNLRLVYPSKSMRNFVTFVRIVLEQGKYNTVEEYAKEAQRQLKEKTSKDNLDAIVSTTVRAQKNVLLRIVPLCVKIALIRLGRVFMRSRQTIIFSNLGKISTPAETGVERYVFNMNVSKNNVQNLGVVTTNDTTTFAFTKYIKENDLPDAFFGALEQNGIKLQRI